MARPQSFDRFQVLDDIMHLVLEVGYEAASVKLICEYVGITRSSFYNAFGTREKMFAELVNHYTAQSFDSAFELATPPIGARALITLVFFQTAKLLVENEKAKGCLITNSVAELCGRHDEPTSVLSALVEKRVAKLVEIVKWGVAAKELPRNFDCEGTALVIQSQFFGLTLIAKTIKDETKLNAMLRTFLQAHQLFDEDALALLN